MTSPPVKRGGGTWKESTNSPAPAGTVLYYTGEAKQATYFKAYFSVYFYFTAFAVLCTFLLCTYNVHVLFFTCTVLRLHYSLLALLCVCVIFYFHCSLLELFFTCTALCLCNFLLALFFTCNDF